MFFRNLKVDVAIVLAILKFDWSDQLVLGSKGVAGLAWSMISISGSFWAIRACLAAAVPSWLRELAGIRSPATDSAVGMDLEFDLKVCRKLRANMGEAVGISASSRPGGHHPIWKDIYAFDSSTASFVRSVSEKEEKGALVRVCSGSKASSSMMDMNSFQKTMLLSSVLCKATEIFILYLLDGGVVCLTTALPWATFFLGIGIYLFNQSNVNDDTHDIIAGRPPTSISPGGPFKIALNIKKPTKHSLSWRIFWILGSIISLLSYALTLYLLSFQPTRTALYWLAYRLVDYYGCSLVYTGGGSESAELDGYSHEFTSYTLQTLPRHLRSKIFNLVLATSKYQSLVHVRRTESYADDSFSEDQIRSMIKLPGLLKFYPVKELVDAKKPDHAFIDIDIVGILGDTLLMSTAWITGLEYTPTDLYDCCVVFFRTPKLTNSSIIKVPCARVLSSPIQSKEGHIPQIVPKGVPNLGYGTEWIYFIPYNGKSYLVLRRPAQFSCKGVHYAQIMSNEEITNMLVGGTLNISLTHVDQVRQTVELAHLMYMKLVELA